MGDEWFGLAGDCVTSTKSGGEKLEALPYISDASRGFVVSEAIQRPPGCDVAPARRVSPSR